MKKRIISLAISFIMIFNFAFVSNAAESSSLGFNESGKFRIMLVNDTHDDETTDKRLIKGLEAAIESEKPDLVVFNGDIFYERFLNPTKETLFESFRLLKMQKFRLPLPSEITTRSTVCQPMS